MGIVEALQAEIENLEAKASKLREALEVVFSAEGHRGRKKGSKMSKAARAKISAAQRKRWAGTRANKGKRRMSAAARKRLSELLKQRWASGKMGKRKAKK